MARVVRVTNPEAFQVPEVKDLFVRSFKDNPFLDLSDEKLAEFAVLVLDPRVGVFVAGEKGEMVGLVIVMLPKSKLDKMPHIPHFANFGTGKSRDALINAMLDFMLESGYTRFWGINATGKGDEAYLKVFKLAGKATRIGSMLEFEIGSD